MNILYRLTGLIEEDIRDLSCVYTITNTTNGKVYVGATTTLAQRFRAHLSDLVNGRHPNKHLQNAVTNDGIHNFRFEILEEVDEALVFDIEMYWITMLGANNPKFGYNKHVVFRGQGRSPSQGKGREIVAFTKSGIYIREFATQVEAAEYFGISQLLVSLTVNCKLPGTKSLYFMRLFDYIESGFKICFDDVNYRNRTGFQGKNFQVGKEVKFSKSFSEADRKAEFEEFYQLQAA